MKALIDIGHADGTGARGHGLEEHACCVRFAQLLQGFLVKAGWQVEVMDFAHLSNSGDLNEAIACGARSDADVLVSLHCDCSDNEQAHGAHVCYYSAAGRDLACHVASYLCELLPGRAEPVQYRSLPILRKTAPVAILCECGFISNAEDAVIIAQHEDLIAQAIASGLCAGCGAEPRMI